MKRDLLATCQAVLAEYDGAITLRQLYYRLVAAQVIPKSAKAYSQLKTNTANWRKAGRLDPDAFCDLTREAIRTSAWPNLPSFARHAEKVIPAGPLADPSRTS